MTENDSMDMARALGSILGHYAHRKTIVINAGNHKEPPLVIHHPDFINLFERYLLNGSVLSDDLISASVNKPYCVGYNNYYKDRYYFYVPGRFNFSSRTSRLLSGRTGVNFITEIISRCREIHYEFVIVDFSNTVCTLRANALVGESALLCLKVDMASAFLSAKENNDALERLDDEQFYNHHRPNIKELFEYSEDILDFREESFSESLVGSSRDYRNVASKIAVRALSRIDKDIKNKLTNHQGKKVDVQL
jgi:hypothetical protein